MFNLHGSLHWGDINSLLLKRELYWIYALNTNAPRGLHEECDIRLFLKTGHSLPVFLYSFIRAVYWYCCILALILCAFMFSYYKKYLFWHIWFGMTSFPDVCVFRLLKVCLTCFYNCVWCGILIVCFTLTRCGYKIEYLCYCIIYFFCVSILHNQCWSSISCLITWPPTFLREKQNERRDMPVCAWSETRGIGVCEEKKN